MADGQIALRFSRISVYDDVSLLLPTFLHNSLYFLPRTMEKYLVAVDQSVKVIFG